MDFELSEKTKDLQQRLTAFMEEHIYPNEQRFNDEIQRERWSPTRIIEELKLKARDAGLWNLFLPHDERGAGINEEVRFARESRELARKNCAGSALLLIRVHSCDSRARIRSSFHANVFLRQTPLHAGCGNGVTVRHLA